MFPRVSIIILNWNGWKDTIECLESVYRIEYPNYDVILIDNGSNNKSVEMIKKYTTGDIKVESPFFEYNPENKPIRVFEIKEEEARKGIFNRPLYEKYDPNRRLILIRNQKNLGYTGGNNMGIKFALSILNSDYVLLLNNDVVVAPDFLRILINAGEKIERSGILGPRIMYYTSPRETQFLGARYHMKPFVKRTFNSRSTKNEHEIPTDEVHGAAIMIKKDILLRIGLLDNSYFAYWEETDFCLRAKKIGVSLYIVPLSRVWHKMGSRRKKRKISPLAAYLFGRNRIYLLHKNFKDIDKLISLIYVIVLFAPSILLSYLFYHRDFEAFQMFIKGLFDGFFRRKEKLT